MRFKNVINIFDQTCSFPKANSLEHQLQITVAFNIDVVESIYKMGNRF